MPLISALIGGATALLGARSASKAAKAQQRASDDQLALQREMFDISRGDLAPYRTGGTQAYNALLSEFGVGDAPAGYTPWSFEETPGYDFRLNEGLRAVEGGVASRQGLNSGAAMKALQRYGQDYATNAFNDERAFQFNNLFNLANMGQSAAAGSANIAQNFGQQGSNAIANRGNAQAAGQIGQYNALMGGLNTGLGLWSYNRNRNNALAQPGIGMGGLY